MTTTTTAPAPSIDAAPTRSGRRIGKIDTLRGIAALMVVLFHYSYTYDEVFGHGDSFWFSFSFGNLGVPLFFIISGFVIFMTLDRTRSGAEFVFARASRLYPVYWLAVLLTTVAVTLFSLPGYAVSSGQLIANLTMFQTFIGVENIDGVYWTMVVELAFYGWMLLALVLGRLVHIEHTVAAWLAALLVVVAVFTAFGFQLPWGWAMALLLYHGHLFAAGILFYRVRSGPTPLLVGLIAGTLALEFVFRAETILIVGLWYLLFVLLVTDRLTFLDRRPLVFLGSISYPLYLLHENIGFIAIRQLYAWGIEDTLLLVLLPLGLSLALATAAHHAVEIPAQRALRGWSRRRAATEVTRDDRVAAATIGPRHYNPGRAIPRSTGTWTSPASATTSRT